MLRLKLFYPLLLFFASLAWGDMGSFAREHLEQLKSDNIPIFYSECRKKMGKALLVFGPSKKKGLLIEQREGVVINLAFVTINQGQFTVEETHGGIYSYERVHKLANELIKYHFTLLLPESIPDILKSKPSRDCLTEGWKWGQTFKNHLTR